MPPPRRNRPAPADLDDLDRPAPRLTRAQPSDPVLGVTTAPASQPAGTRGRGVRTASTKAKTSFYVSVAAANRARAAWTWTRAQEGHLSFSDFIAHALACEVVRMEEKYNEGKPWPPMAAGEIGTGKPIGS